MRRYEVREYPADIVGKGTLELQVYCNGELVGRLYWMPPTKKKPLNPPKPFGYKGSSRTEAFKPFGGLLG